MGLSCLQRAAAVCEALLVLMSAIDELPYHLLHLGDGTVPYADTMAATHAELLEQVGC